MKHMIISLLCLLFVVVYSFFTIFYVSDFKSQIDIQLTSQSDTISIKDCEAIKEIFEGRKNVLYFILNNEDADNFKEIIINLENAVKYNDIQGIDTYRQLLESIMDKIVQQNKSVI